jgi:aspartyl-tRNA(Asn)/glutamyl-tRNA(Gln) amidotransferase subunit A
MEIMSGADPYDSTSSSKEVPNYVKHDKVSSSKFAVIKEAVLHPGVDSEIKAFIQETIDKLRKDGHVVDEVSFPYIEYMVPTYYVLSTAEASSNLSRFDGVHYGYRSPNAKGVEETYKKSRSEGFGPEVKRRIMAGTFVLSHGYYDAYYTKGQKVRRILKDKTDEILNEYDAVLMPTTPNTAFELNAVKDPISMYLQDIFTVHANLTGNPALSLPLGHHTNGMPFGLQIMAKHFDEKRLFDIAAYIESLN